MHPLKKKKKISGWSVFLHLLGRAWFCQSLFNDFRKRVLWKAVIRRRHGETCSSWPRICEANLAVRQSSVWATGICAPTAFALTVPRSVHCEVASTWSFPRSANGVLIYVFIVSLYWLDRTGHFAHDFSCRCTVLAARSTIFPGLYVATPYKRLFSERSWYISFIFVFIAPNIYLFGWCGRIAVKSPHICIMIAIYARAKASSNTLVNDSNKKYNSRGKICQLKADQQAERRIPPFNWRKRETLLSPGSTVDSR